MKERVGGKMMMARSVDGKGRRGENVIKEINGKREKAE